MKTIQKIIEQAGGIENLPLSIPNEPYMRLCIEQIGAGPRGYPALSVAHYFEQEGDLCQDPEICFELVPRDGQTTYEPYMYQQAIPPIYQEVYDEGVENTRLKRRLTEFAREWGQNLEAQGFIRAAARMIPTMDTPQESAA